MNENQKKKNKHWEKICWQYTYHESNFQELSEKAVIPTSK